MRVIDYINNHKPNQIWFSGQGTQSENKEWELKREKLFPFLRQIFVMSKHVVDAEKQFSYI